MEDWGEQTGGRILQPASDALATHGLASVCLVGVLRLSSKRMTARSAVQ